MQRPSSPNECDMGSLDRLDSFDDYFLLNSPPESPQQPLRMTPGGVAVAGAASVPPPPGTPYDIYGYYSGSGNNAVASQGNIKLSTSNISVDRSNAVPSSSSLLSPSSGARHYHPRHDRHNSVSLGRVLPATQREIDEIIKMDDKDINLTELFLKNNYRTSLNENYQAKGALKGHDTELHKNRSNSLCSSVVGDNESNPGGASSLSNNNYNRHPQNGVSRCRNTGDKDGLGSSKHKTNNNNKDDDDTNTNNASDTNNDSSMDYDFGVEPTPLSEIRAKSEQRLREQQQQREKAQQASRNSNGLTAQQLQHHTYMQHKQHSSYYPFGRSYQLPIPTMLPISPPEAKKTAAAALTESPPLADAIATAAAIASVQTTTTSSTKHTVPNPIAPKPAPPNQQQQPQHERTPPHSPPIQSSSHHNTPTSLSWQRQQQNSNNNNNGSRPQSRNSNKSNNAVGSPRQQSHSPSPIPPPQRQQHPHYQQKQQQHHPHHPPPPHYHPQQQQHHHQHHQNHHHHPPSSHHPSYQHPLAPPLSAASYHPGAPKIVGPYTTAQQESNSSHSGSSRRRTAMATSGVAKATSTTTTTTTTTVVGTASNKTATTAAAAASRLVVPAPAPPVTYLPRRGDHRPREASVAHSTPKGALEDAAKLRRGYSGFHKPATSQTTNNYHHPLPSKFQKYNPSGPRTTIYAQNNNPTTNGGGTMTTTTTSGNSQSPHPTTSPSPQPPSSAAAKVEPVTTANYANGSLLHHHHQQQQQHAPTPAATILNNYHHPPADTAYERKKQRAKDARVKLNESIERLHVSMGVAGTESKRRTEQLRVFMQAAGRSNESTTDHQAFQLMESCVKTAESAKKWDRPNFVGSAATMIQCLNSQCEILMRELMEYQQGKDPGTPRRPVPPVLPPTGEEGAPAESSDKEPADADANQQEQETEMQQEQEPWNGKRVQEASGDKNHNPEELPEKRRRLNGIHDDDGYDDDDEKKEASSATDGGDAKPVSSDASTATMMCFASGNDPNLLEDSVMDLIASFLDPVSIVQCRSVCKNWRESESCFTKYRTWMNLSVKRFGFFKVRQWQAKQSDGDDNENDNDDDNDNGTAHENGEAGHHDVMKRAGGVALYSSMHLANVMPTAQLGGNHVFLGTTRLPGSGVAAWMFLAERSNGETMRSVKRNPESESSSRGGGIYTSLPVVELKVVIQNIGCRKAQRSIVIRDQRLLVDASTRRRGEQLTEIYWDDRFKKELVKLDGSSYYETMKSRSNTKPGELARLELFDTIVLVAFIHARRCSTTAKFIQRSNFMKVLVTVNDTTHPLVIPISKQKGDSDAPKVS